MWFFSERASESIHQLRYALEERQFAEGEGEAGFDQCSVDRGNDDSENAAWQELQHSHAGKITLKANSLKIVRNCTNFCYNVFYLFLVNQLKTLLQHQERMESEVSPSRRKTPFCVCVFFLFLLCCLDERHAWWDQFSSNQEGKEAPNHFCMLKYRRFLRLWPELGMLITTEEEKEISNTRFRLFSSFVDHAVWVTVHQKFILFVLETVGINYVEKFL